MKIKLIFTEEERTDAELAMKSRALHSILLEIDQDLRNKIKYEDLPTETQAAYQNVRDLIRELVEHYDIPLL
jgi:hypothetical protein